MTVRAKFAAFLAAIVAVFGLSYAVGSAFDLRDEPPAHMEMP